MREKPFAGLAACRRVYLTPRKSSARPPGACGQGYSSTGCELPDQSTSRQHVAPPFPPKFQFGSKKSREQNLVIDSYYTQRQTTKQILLMRTDQGRLIN